MSLSKIEAAIEAILFSMGEAVPVKKIAEAMEMGEEDCHRILVNMKDKYDNEQRGISLIEVDESFQLATKRDYYEQVKRVNHKLREFILTDVLIETLAIIAYQQPITKAHIEAVRGVNSNHAVNKLVEYNLICEIGRMDAPGKPILFGTTKDFLRGFGFQSVEDLPQVGEDAMDRIKSEVEKEVQLTIMEADDGEVTIGDDDLQLDEAYDNKYDYDYEDKEDKEDE